MIYALLLVPLAGAVLAFFAGNRPGAAYLLPLTGALHLVLTIATWFTPVTTALDGRLELDPLGKLFLTSTSVLFFIIAFYAAGYLRTEEPSVRRDFQQGALFKNAPQAVFSGCLLLFLDAMTVTTMAQHMGILWVAVEATTISTAPLIYFHRHHRSLEAVWKYLVVCSVGIALALLGTFLTSIALSGSESHEIDLYMPQMIEHADEFNIPWLKAAFICLVVGYGTKMGLAPLHTWLPDAYSEAPSVFSAASSGILLNGAFLGILRAFQLCSAAGEADFAQDILLAFGISSLLVAAALLLRQTDFKRMLAYSSVEHMGLLALGIGAGSVGAFPALLHSVNHALTKAALFLLAGNILTVYRTKIARDVHGAATALPWTGSLWVLSILAITGAPPFGIFASKFLLIRSLFAADLGWIGITALILLVVVFVGLAGLAVPMVFGPPPPRDTLHSAPKLSWSVIPPLVLLVLTLVSGFFLPRGMRNGFDAAADSIFPRPKLTTIHDRMSGTAARE